MTTATIRKRLVDYIKSANDKKVQAIYTIMEDEINTLENDWDEDFKGELDQRSEDFSKGTAKTFTWAQTKRAAMNKVKGIKK